MSSLCRHPGKETRGAGTASATVRSELRADGAETRVVVHTSLNVTGRPAQFGRGVMADVSGKLIGIFADNLASMLAAGSPAGNLAKAAPADAEPAATAPVTTAPAPAVAPPTAVPPGGSHGGSTDDALDLLNVAGLPVLKRAIPVAALIVAAVVALRLRIGRRRARSRQLACAAR